MRKRQRLGPARARQFVDEAFVGEGRQRLDVAAQIAAADRQIGASRFRRATPPSHRVARRRAGRNRAPPRRRRGQARRRGRRRRRSARASWRARRSRRARRSAARRAAGAGGRGSGRCWPTASATPGASMSRAMAMAIAAASASIARPPTIADWHWVKRDQRRVDPRVTRRRCAGEVGGLGRRPIVRAGRR